MIRPTSKYVGMTVPESQPSWPNLPHSPPVTAKHREWSYYRKSASGRDGYVEKDSEKRTVLRGEWKNAGHSILIRTNNCIFIMDMSEIPYVFLHFAGE